jgi:hypothetical protein
VDRSRPDAQGSQHPGIPRHVRRVLEISADAVELVEQEFRARRGASFRFDATTGENVWADPDR